MDKNELHFDYIIIGAGAAGLMLAKAMGEEPMFKTKSILIIDKDSKQTNDRTWCFWEKGAGTFDDILHKTWNTIRFCGSKYRAQLEIAPYRYKMIRGIEFYRAHMKTILGHEHISFIQDQVIAVEDQKEQVQVRTSGKVYTASKVFNSIFEYKKITDQEKYPVLQQHFIGWFIKADTPVFDESSATFMDFSIPQKGNTRFMYVLPFSPDEALVEYTLFSQERLQESEYEEAIADYMKNVLSCSTYRITEKERGSIPMTSYNFEAHNSTNVLHIGTAGGWAKPSTGYTFMNTYKNTAVLLQHLKGKKAFANFSVKKRYRFYDMLLLDILFKRNDQGGRIFETLFEKRSPQLIFKFLDEETGLWEDLKVISGCPKRIFIAAFIHRLLGNPRF